MIYRELEGRLGYVRDPSTGAVSLYVNASPDDVLAVVPGTYLELPGTRKILFGYSSRSIATKKEYHISAKHINDGIFKSFPELREAALARESVRIGIYEP